jgi:hypothetical protein
MNTDVSHSGCIHLPTYRPTHSPSHGLVPNNSQRSECNGPPSEQRAGSVSVPTV